MKVVGTNTLKLILPAAIVASVTWLGGCATNSASSPVVPKVQQMSAVIRVCDSLTAGCSGESSISLGALHDLQVSVDWTNMPGGTHSQQIAFLLPNGVVYQTVSHGFAVPDGALGSPTVSDGMAVAGTYITQRQMTGNWTVQVSLDGAVISSQQVTLEP